MEEEKKSRIIVSIRCTAFNQAPYIRKCLEGFVMQKTNFPFEAIVHDDASTDGTADIIKEFSNQYPEIIKPILDTENQWSKHDESLTRIMDEACTGKYIATCEGDDFWTDPYKLQKQVNFLEDHPNYTLVHTDFDYVNLDSRVIPTPDIPLYQNLKQRKREGHIWQYQLVYPSSILYCSCLYRNGILKNEETFIDHGLFLCCGRKGKVHYIDEKTSAYRINPEGTMKSKQDFVLRLIRNAIFIQLYYFCNSKYDIDNYYNRNLNSRVKVSEAIISSIASWRMITVKKKYSILFYIIFMRPINLLLLPTALTVKLLRRLNISRG